MFRSYCFRLRRPSGQLFIKFVNKIKAKIIFKFTVEKSIADKNEIREFLFAIRRVFDL